jgi:hypothetical protein
MDPWPPPRYATAVVKGVVTAHYSNVAVKTDLQILNRIVDEWRSRGLSFQPGRT